MMTKSMAFVLLLVVLGVGEVAGVGGSGTKEEARRAVCRYHSEGECRSNGCTWCLGVCRKLQDGVSCKKEEDEMRKFEEELQRVLGAEGEGRGQQAQERGGAGEALGRRAGRTAATRGRGARTVRTSGRRRMGTQFLSWTRMERTMARRVTESLCRGFYSGTLERTCVSQASRYMSVEATGCGRECSSATTQCRRIPGLSRSTCYKIGRYVGQFSALQEVEEGTDAPAPATPAPPSMTCGTKACKAVTRLCKLLLSGDAETVCVEVAPYVTSYTAWKTIKTVALELWDLLKGGGLSVKEVFRVVMSALEASGGITFFEDLYDELVERATAFYNKVVALGEALVKGMLGLAEALPVILQRTFTQLAAVSNGGRLEETCWRCADEFEMLSKILGLDDPCVKAITASMWSAYNAYSAATPAYFAMSSYTSVSYAQCSAINSFICGDIGCNAFS